MANEGVHQHCFLALARARGEHDRALADARAQGLSQGEHFGGRGDVELDVAGHRHPAGAELGEARGVGRGLRADRGERLHGQRGQRRQPRVAAGGAIGQARVGQHHRDTAAAAGGEQVGPQLGLHDHAEHRPEVTQEGVGEAADVIGQIGAQHARLVREQRARGVAAGGGHVGEQHAVLGPAREQGAHQRFGGARLAHRHGMHPDHRQRRTHPVAPEALADVPQVGGLAARPPQQAKQHQGQGENPQQGVGQAGQHLDGASRDRASISKDVGRTLRARRGGAARNPSHA